MTHWSISLDPDAIAHLPSEVRETADVRVGEARTLLVFRDRFSALKAARRLGAARVEPLARPARPV